MIKKFKCKRLRALYKGRSNHKVPPEMVDRVERILTLLDVAANKQDLNVPGLRLHQLNGELCDFFAVSVTGNWRVIFRFSEGVVTDVDLIDYHGE